MNEIKTVKKLFKNLKNKIFSRNNDTNLESDKRNSNYSNTRQ